MSSQIPLVKISWTGCWAGGMKYEGVSIHSGCLQRIFVDTALWGFFKLRERELRGLLKAETWTRTFKTLFSRWQHCNVSPKNETHWVQTLDKRSSSSQSRNPDILENSLVSSSSPISSEVRVNTTCSWNRKQLNEVYSRLGKSNLIN